MRGQGNSCARVRKGWTLKRTAGIGTEGKDLEQTKEANHGAEKIKTDRERSSCSGKAPERNKMALK